MGPAGPFTPKVTGLTLGPGGPNVSNFTIPRGHGPLGIGPNIGPCGPNCYCCGQFFCQAFYLYRALRALLLGGQGPLGPPVIGGFAPKPPGRSELGLLLLALFIFYRALWPGGHGP